MACSKNPFHARRQGYTPGKPKLKGYSGTKSGAKKSSTRYSASTPKIKPLPNGDATSTYGSIYRNN